MSPSNQPNEKGAAPVAPFVICALAGFAGAAGVALAAIAAHRVESPALATAAYMLMIHAGAATALVAVSAALGSKPWLWPAGLMLFAVSLFSGTIALNTLSAFSAPAMLAPIGGSLTILSWLAVVAVAIRELRSVPDTHT